MKSHEADNLLNVLSSKLLEWGTDCHTRGVSCGSVFKLSAGTGMGDLEMVHLVLGQLQLLS